MNKKESVVSVLSLVGRLFGDKAKDFFAFFIEDVEAEKEYFRLESIEGRTVVSGNSVSAVCFGLNFYLKYYAGIYVQWNGEQPRTITEWPVVPKPITKVCWAKHRYFMNFCTFGYSLAFANWAEWERLIDWMALNGINRPLAITGHELVWNEMALELGLDQDDMDAFVPGAVYMPWGWMGGLDGWGGGLPDGWSAKRKELAQVILKRERALGMTPVLQGFSGHVPKALVDKNPEMSSSRVNWFEWETFLLNPVDPAFPKISELFHAKQKALFGMSDYYAADPFIEMVPPSGALDYLAQVSRAVLSGIKAFNPNAKWVFQSWMFMFQQSFWTVERSRAFLDAVDAEDMLILDLWCEKLGVWKRTNAFHGKEWAWCNIQNFGGNVHLTGALDVNNRELPALRMGATGNLLTGIGFANEALCASPVNYDFLFESAWRESPVDLDAWATEYAFCRYGVRHADLAKAWQILVHSVFREYEYEFCPLLLRPELPLEREVRLYPEDVIQALDLLFGCEWQLMNDSVFEYDVVNFTRQLLSDYSILLLERLYQAKESQDQVRFKQASMAVKKLILDMEMLVSTRSEFLLGRWLEGASRWEDSSESGAGCLGWGARRLVTLWGDGNWDPYDYAADPRANPDDPLEPPHGFSLRDYARRPWAGLLSDYYLPRWEKYFSAVQTAWDHQEEFDISAFHKKLVDWERQWSFGLNTYPAQAREKGVKTARQLFLEYRAKFAEEAVKGGE